MTAPVIVVCCCADDPERRVIPGSKARPCDGCGATIVVSRATLARSDVQHPDSRLLCVLCGTKEMDGVELHPPTAAQITELAAAGYDPQAWALREQWGKKLRVKR